MSVNLNTNIANNGISGHLAHAPYLNIPAILQVVEAEKATQTGFDITKVFELLPSDMNGVNFEPVYELLAETGKARQLLNYERQWEPTIFSITYNGPISEDGLPLSSNVTKWRKFTAAQLEQDRMDIESGELPVLFKQAVEHLLSLAEEGHGITWRDCSMGEDIVAQRAALRLMQSALQTLSEVIEENAQEEVERLTQQLVLIGQVQSGGVR